ncbi:MAG: putative C-S lyase, partial [Tissierellia bacterium]|nr:putative C-S lyase [Tissierellia bacterium]
MAYDFDKIINRQGTNSVKWDNLMEVFGREDILPLWVADMDFRAPDEVIEALQEKLNHGIFGYNIKSDSLYNSIISWMKKRYNWDIKKEWISFTPGVVPALNIAVREFAKEGDNIVIQPPVYPPFFRVLENNAVEANLNPLIYKDDNFVMDYDSLEKSIDSKTKAIILCNPHNPVGRVWSKEELSKLGEICLKHNLLIVSDDIHSDLTFKGHRTTPIATISEELAQNTITLLAPSKTFNIAGLATSVAIIPNEELRNKFERGIEKLEIGKVTTFGGTALEAAYTSGEQWLD